MSDQNIHTGSPRGSLLTTEVCSNREKEMLRKNTKAKKNRSGQKLIISRSFVLKTIQTVTKDLGLVSAACAQAARDKNLAVPPIDIQIGSSLKEGKLQHLCQQHIEQLLRKSFTIAKLQNKKTIKKRHCIDTIQYSGIFKNLAEFNYSSLSEETSDSDSDESESSEGSICS